MQLLAPLCDRALVHLELHETTDTDESVFRPAQDFDPVDDSAHPQPEFQQAVITAVAKVTHIAPADDNGESSARPWSRRASSSTRSGSLGCVRA